MIVYTDMVERERHAIKLGLKIPKEKQGYLMQYGITLQSNIKLGMVKMLIGLLKILL